MSLNTRNALATFDVNGWGGRRRRTWGRKKNEKYVEIPFIIMKINEKIRIELDFNLKLKEN